MALYDMGILNFEEPYTKFRAHGLLIRKGRKISKSRGNVIVPDSVIAKFGADTVRLYLMFLGPFEQGWRLSRGWHSRSLQVFEPIVAVRSRGRTADVRVSTQSVSASYH